MNRAGRRDGGTPLGSAVVPSRVRTGVGAAGDCAADQPRYLLLRDAVSTPRSYLSDSALGLMSPPRATPRISPSRWLHTASTAALW